MSKIFCYTLFLVFLLTACEQETSALSCELAFNDKVLFQNAISDEFKLLEVELNSSCLKTTILYRGGSGEASFQLVGSGSYAYTNPPSLDVRLLFEDEDFCKAELRKKFYFDLSDLHLDESLIINLEGWEKPVFYEK